MSNNGFQCKQFYIAHDLCAMKVGTDSLILGSWVDGVNQVRKSNAVQVLDIGTGSGLLAIMMAQKLSSVSAQIHAVEPNAEAFNQALTNMQASPWAECFELRHGRIQEAQFETGQFDLIVCNPPYFEQQKMHVNDKNAERFTDQRRMARHQDSLSFNELLSCVANLLADNGEFYCVLPSEQALGFESILAEYGLLIRKKLNVKTTVKKPVKRCCWCIVKAFEGETEEQELVIHDSDGSYSDAYKELCGDFYLNF